MLIRLPYDVYYRANARLCSLLRAIAHRENTTKSSTKARSERRAFSVYIPSHTSYTTEFKVTARFIPMNQSGSSQFIYLCNVPSLSRRLSTSMSFKNRPRPYTFSHLLHDLSAYIKFPSADDWSSFGHHFLE